MKPAAPGGSYRRPTLIFKGFLDILRILLYSEK